MLFRISLKQNAVNCRKLRLLHLATRSLGLDAVLSAVLSNLKVYRRVAQRIEAYGGKSTRLLDQRPLRT